MLRKGLDNNTVAIIDLGSNTFHLLILKVGEGNLKPFEPIFRKRIFVYLLGKDKNKITHEAKVKALDCLGKFKKYLINYNVSKVKVIATEALRAAQNKYEIIQDFQSVLGFPIEIIDGHKEAEYIYRGVKLLDNHFYNPSLIIDIGGGSVEFILGTKEKIIKLISVKAGITFLRHNFVSSDPLTKYNKDKIFLYLDQILSAFIDDISKYKPIALIGSSGPFEIIEALDVGNMNNRESIVYSKEHVLKISKEIDKYNKVERARMKNMPQDRSDLSKESFFLINYILLKIPSIQKVIVSPYGIKEGVASMLLNLE